MIIKRKVPQQFKRLTKKNSFIVYVGADESINTSSMHWSGGSISAYELIDLASGAHIKDINGVPWPNFEEKRIDIEPGQALVKSGMFCGKTSTLSFTVNRADLHYLSVDDSEVIGSGY
tara:strand:+ start:465 stop:818 length:354 start_codon:yes stop_codon:yes gene_type:complete